MGCAGAKPKRDIESRLAALKAKRNSPVVDINVGGLEDSGEESGEESAEKRDAFEYLLIQWELMQMTLPGVDEDYKKELRACLNEHKPLAGLTMGDVLLEGTKEKVTEKLDDQAKKDEFIRVLTASGFGRFG